jgi:transposase
MLIKHDMELRRLVRSQIRDIEGTRLERLEQASGDGPHVMVHLLARVIGVGIETADMLVRGAQPKLARPSGGAALWGCRRWTRSLVRVNSTRVRFRPDAVAKRQQKPVPTCRGQSG